jgi:hypothetical protein
MRSTSFDAEVVMRVSVSSELWNSIYYNLRDHYLDDPEWVAKAREAWHHSLTHALLYEFAKLGIRVIQDIDGRWTHVDLPDGDALFELILRWS